MKRRALVLFVAACGWLGGLAPEAGAQNSGPEATPIIDSIPTPRDVPFPGVITELVDASDNTRGIFQVRETIPVPAAGPLTLLYPKWLPGHHSPVGPIAELAELKKKLG